ncbi:DUF4229 domain-containing protein [Leucobacter sp. gxy201]|uniref:DUF4229 domain-containing protein n=1 Tax=Leucobacter sp. gxy201 TaxID=2957200 RepID=UPI003DA0AC50
MSKTRNAWTVYIVLRLLFFAVPFGLMYVIGVRVWLAAVFAALIGVALSVLLLSKQRSVASESIYEWRTRDHGRADALVEDDAVDAAETPETETPAADPGQGSPSAGPAN